MMITPFGYDLQYQCHKAQILSKDNIKYYQYKHIGSLLKDVKIQEVICGIFHKGLGLFLSSLVFLALGSLLWDFLSKLYTFPSKKVNILRSPFSGTFHSFQHFALFF